jgi:small GTP-binding protein
MISYKIVLVGKFGVGKTSLIRRFVENSFSEEYLSTIGVSISKKIVQNATIMIWDIEGETQFKPIFKQYLKGSKGFIIVADLLRDDTIESIKEHIGLCNEVVKDAPIAIALNKSDLEHNFSQKDLEKLLNLSDDIVSVKKTSAKSGNAVEEIFLDLHKAIMEKIS